MGILSKIGLAVPVTIGNIIGKGLSLVGVPYAKTTIQEASETKFGKVLGIAITGTAAAAGVAAIGTSAAATAVVAKLGKVASSVIKATPTPIKTGVITAGAIAALAPQTTKAILSSPEATKTAVASIVSPAAGVVVGLEQGSGLLSTAIEQNFPRVADAIEEYTPEIIGAGVITAGAVAASQLIGSSEDILESVSVLPTTANQVQAVPTTTAEMISPESPILPETQVITASTGSSSGSTRKRRRKALPSKISQSVRVNINNNNSAHRITKRYLNVIPLRN